MPSFQLCIAPVKIVKTDTIWPPTFQRQLGVTLQVVHMWLICSNRKLYHKKKIFLLPWHHPTIIFLDSLTIFTAQIAHSHMYWGKLCLHSLADQNVHRLEKNFSTKYHAKTTWTVPLDPPDSVVPWNGGSVGNYQFRNKNLNNLLPDYFTVA